jgi:hypothetical protein
VAPPPGSTAGSGGPPETAPAGSRSGDLASKRRPRRGEGPGSTFEHARGFALDLPEGWTAGATGTGAFLTPPEVAAGKETYWVAAEPLGVAPTVRDPRLIASVDRRVAAGAPFLRRTSGPDELHGDGVGLVYEGTNREGELVRAVALVRALGTQRVSVVGLGLNERVAAREHELRRIFVSLRATGSGRRGN